MTAKNGRPPLYSPELAAKVLDQLIESSLAAVCRKSGMPSVTTVLKWVRDIPEFAMDYACVRELQGEYDADRVGAIAEEVLEGKLGAAEARVAIDAYKWSAGKRLSKKYGDRVHNEHSGVDGAPIQTTATVAVAGTVTLDAEAAYRRLIHGEDPESGATGG